MQLPPLYYFKSLRELDDWCEKYLTPTGTTILEPHPFIQPLSLASSPNPNKLLVCHDMMGGYKEDTFVSEQYNSNHIFHLTKWQSIETLVYFSHNRITLPPPAWTKLAHENGVCVLGTVITEWEEGIPENEKLIDNMDLYCKALVALAKIGRFDGWFINVESPSSPRVAQGFCSFLANLTERVHAELGGRVVWYDSLTEQGQIRWQNKLSPLNQCFFFNCDAMFTNYTWQEDDPAKSALLARGRKYDVYTGIDVHGRNTWGGGGWDCWRAMEKSLQAGTSVALFAWAWLYEAFADEDNGKSQTSLDRMKFYRQRERRFFQGASEFADKCSVVRYFDLRPLQIIPGQDFSTSFSLPFGDRFAVQGETVAHGKNWTLLWHQSILPTFDSWVFQSQEDRTVSMKNAPISAFVTTRHSFFKGSSLVVRLRGCQDTGGGDLWVPLFLLNYTSSNVKGGKHFLIFVVKVLDKERMQGNVLSMYLKCSNGDILKFPVILGCKDQIEYKNEWTEFKFTFDLLGQAAVTEIGIVHKRDVSNGTDFPWTDVLALGALHLTNDDQVDDMPLHTIHSVSCDEAGHLVSWECELPLEHYLLFNIYGNGKWLGSSYDPLCRFLVDPSALAEKQISDVLFKVQPVLRKLFRTVELSW